MAISAKEVKELRERTSAPMMECKKALTEAVGDVEKAIKILRERGIAKAAKRRGVRPHARHNTGVKISIVIHTPKKRFCPNHPQTLA